MTLHNEYIQNLRNLMADIIRRATENPGKPWVQPASVPLLDGYNRPYRGLDLLAVTRFRQLCGSQTPLFCHAYQRKLFRQPVVADEPGVPTLKKDGKVVRVYPCQVRNGKLNEKTKRVEEERKRLVSKSVMRLHLEKISPVNEDGLIRHIYKNITKEPVSLGVTDRLCAEMSTMLVALELGLPKKVEPENIQFLHKWQDMVMDEDFNMNEFLASVMDKVQRELTAIERTEIKEEVFRKNLKQSMENLELKDKTPHFKNLNEVLTPSIRVSYPLPKDGSIRY